MNAVEVIDVAKSFGKVQALRRVSFTLVGGGIYGYLGHNGAGKTTTLRILMGIYRPTRGVVRVLGRDPYLERSVLRRVGYVSETNGFHPKLTVAENLTYFARLYGVGDSEIRRVMEEFEIEDMARTRFEKLSAGMKRRVAIARAFLKNPDLLLLDEPFSNLDPVWRSRIKNLLTTLARKHGVTILMASHILEDVEQLCSGVVVIRNGYTLFSGSLERLAKIVGGGAKTYELHVSDTGRAAKLVEALAVRGNLRTRVIEGTRLVIEVPGGSSDDVQELVADIVGLLVRNDVRVYQVYERRRTLNEIYEALQRWEA